MTLEYFMKSVFYAALYTCYVVGWCCYESLTLFQANGLAAMGQFTGGTDLANQSLFVADHKY